MPRIIAGTRKSLLLETPKKDGVRPTYDRTKESLFNIVDSRYPYQKQIVLDIFSGTGSIGLEFLSRGAEKAVFIDKDISITKSNVAKCRFEDKTVIIKSDWQKGLAKLKEEQYKFSHIFLDPPYSSGLYERVIENSDLYDIMDKNAVVIAELSEEDTVLKKTSNLVLIDKRKYGICVFAFYVKGNYEDLDLSGKF